VVKKRSIQKQAIKRAYLNIKKSGLAIIPSRVGYTLLGNTDQAIKKMFELKGRPLSKPCVILTRYDFLDQIAQVPKKYQPFIQRIEQEKLLCGFILKRRKHPVFSSLSPFANEYSKRPDGTSCFVINAGDYIQYLVDNSLKDGTVVVGSSANKSGTGNEGIFGNIPQNILDGVDDYIEDDNFVSFEYNPQTREQGVMVDLNGDKPVVIRKGLQYPYIQSVLDEYMDQSI
jgi:tRNA A37 threonylcarbamoyladenosine synthetase subunit TsaC/SUA5/YrdC